MGLFRFKYFDIEQKDSVFKIGTDALVLGSWLEFDRNTKTILDIGSGTGVLSLMLAQKSANATITALDINPDAVVLAEQNFRRNELGKRCRAIHSNFLQFTATSGFDLIVSNPPFFVDAFNSNNPVIDLAKHANTSKIEQFFEKSVALLNENGKLALIYPSDSSFLNFASKMGLYPQRNLHVYGKPGVLKRRCSIFGFEKIEELEENLIIRDDLGNYTDAYRLLTKDYHGVKI